MNRREVLRTSAMGLLFARMGELAAAAQQSRRDATDEYRYGHALTGSEMLLVEETKGGTGAAAGFTKLPDESAFIIPVSFDQTTSKFVKSQEFKADLDPKGKYRMQASIKSIHLRQDIANQIKQDTLQVRTVNSVGTELQDWVSWLVFTMMEVAFKQNSGKGSGLVALGGTAPLASGKKDEQANVQDGKIQVSFEVFGQKKDSWLFKILKGLSSSTVGSILAQVAFPKQVQVARNFIMQTVQEMDKQDKNTPILISSQGTYGVVTGTREIYKLGKGFWALVSLTDLQRLDFLRGYTLDFDDMQFALKTNAGARVDNANYMVVELDFPETA